MPIAKWFESTFTTLAALDGQRSATSPNTGRRARRRGAAVVILQFVVINARFSNKRGDNMIGVARPSDFGRSLEEPHDDPHP